MNVTEFFDELKQLDLDDDCVLVHFAGNYTGNIRVVRVESNKVVLSAEFRPNGETLCFYDLCNKIEELAKSAETYDYDVVYRCPSKGNYNIESVKRGHYDYSEDGDDIYDCCEIYCSDKKITKNNINPDDYEDFFESLLKIKNKPMNETIDGKYADACFRAERIIASFCKEYGKEITKMAFERELEDIDF